MASLERQLDDKVAELSDNTTASAQTEKELADKLKELYQVSGTRSLSAVYSLTSAALHAQCCCSLTCSCLINLTLFDYGL